MSLIYSKYNINQIKPYFFYFGLKPKMVWFKKISNFFFQLGLRKLQTVPNQIMHTYRYLLGLDLNSVNSSQFGIQLNLN